MCVSYLNATLKGLYFNSCVAHNMVASATFVPVVNTNPLVCAAALNPSGCPVGALFVYSVYSTYKLKHFNAIGDIISGFSCISFPVGLITAQHPKPVSGIHNHYLRLIISFSKHNRRTVLMPFGLL